MKQIFLIFIILLSLLLNNALGLYEWDVLDKQPRRAYWAWKPITLNNWDGQPSWMRNIDNYQRSADLLIDFCRSKSINVIYLYVGAWEWEGGAYFQNHQLYSEAGYEYIITNARKYCIDVWGLFYIWDNPNDLSDYENAITNIIDSVIAYNERYPDAMFVGVQNDQEPSNSGEYGNLLNMLAIGTNHIKKRKDEGSTGAECFKLSSTLKPAWIAETYTYNSVTKEMHKHVMDIVHHGALMAYRDTAAGILGFAEPFVAYCSSINKPGAVGVETGWINASGVVTFDEEIQAEAPASRFSYMEGELDTVLATLSNYPGFDRFIIHDWPQYFYHWFGQEPGDWLDTQTTWTGTSVDLCDDESQWAGWPCNMIPIKIIGFIPSEGCVSNTIVTITGDGFGDNQGSGVVRFNGILASITIWSDKKIEAVVPSGPATGPISVTNNDGDGAVTTNDFKVLNTGISGFSPSSGCVGDTVSVNGSGFGTSQGGGKVRFNGVIVNNYITWSDTNIQVLVPTGAGPGPISVTNDCGSSDITGSSYTPSDVGLKIKKTADKTNASGGEIVTYKIVIENISSCPAKNVKITDVMPDNTVYIENSIRWGPTNVNYSGATNLTDNAGDDKACISGNKVIFSFKEGTAPASGGTLLPGESVAGFFQVMINTNAPGSSGIDVIEACNSGADGNFDGYIIEGESTSNIQDYLWAGDTAMPGGSPSSGFVKIYQSADNRDHSITNLDGGGWGCEDSDVLQVGNTKVGGSGYDNRAFLTFSLVDVTVTWNITTATLYVKEQDYTTNPDVPYHFDHVIYSNIFDTASELQQRYDCSSGARKVQQADFYLINNQADLEVNNVWHKAPCTESVKWCMTNLRSWSENGSQRIFQVRIRDDSLAGAGNNDSVRFYSQNAASANRPYLIVHYMTSGITNKEVRGFTAFNLSSIQAGTVITTATLFIHCISETNGAEIEPIMIDHVDYSNSLEAGDFNAPEIESGFMVFAAGNDLWVSGDAADQVRYAFTNAKIWSRNGSDRWFQIRIRPSQITIDDNMDRQLLSSAEVSNRAYIKVYYTNIPTFTPDAVTNIGILNGMNFVNISGTNIVTITITTQTQVTPPLSISKSVSNVMLGNDAINGAIPGSIIIYKIEYSNSSITTSSNAIIYDFIASNNIYKTNYMGSGTTGWTSEWSTNALSGQSWGSSDYTNIMPTLKSQIRWIRWKKITINSGEKGVLILRMIIK